MSEILFGQSYFLRFDPKLWQAQQPFPPLGTLYAASYLREQGYKVALFDAMLAESPAGWQTALELERPRYAVLYEDNFNYLSKMCLTRMRQAAFQMIAQARAANCSVIICGADASDHPDDYLEAGADFILIGEGEYTLGELINHLEGHSQQPIEQIAGLAWSGPDNSEDQTNHAVIKTPRRPDIRKLDALPFPAWDLVDIPKYQQAWRDKHGYYAINMVTTRGCPFHCNWCAKPIWGQRYNVRSPENVVEELEWLQKNIRPDSIWFVDDIFGLKPGWVARLAELIEARGLQISFKCLGRVDLLMRPGEIDALKHAGAEIVWVGAESGSQKILDAMDKGTRVDQIYAVTQQLHNANIQVGFFLQFGYPGEERHDIDKTLQMVRDCRPDDIGMSVSYPLPGTKFYAAVKNQLGPKQNWYDSEDLAMLYQGPFTTAFYRQLHTRLHCEFRARKAWRSFVSRTKPRKSARSRLEKHPNKLLALIKFFYYSFKLPVEKLRLERLARLPHQGIQALPQTMAPSEAATPSNQESL